MKVYKDVFTGDELFSDSYPFCPPFDDPELADVAVEIQTTRKTKKEQDFGIADNSEEGEGGLSSEEETVIDLVDAFHLSPAPLDTKKLFNTYFKDYMKKVMERLEKEDKDKIPTFKSKIAILFKKLTDMFDDLVFYMGQSMDMDATLGIGYYKDAELAPRIIFILAGTVEERF